MAPRLGHIVRIASSTLLCSTLIIVYSTILSRPHIQSNIAKFNMEMWQNKLLPPNVPDLGKDNVCVQMLSRLGNKLFQYASTYGIAKQNNFTFIIEADDDFRQYFNFTSVQITPGVCNSFEKVLEAKACCSYDPLLMNLTRGRNYRVGDWLQSWKYFRDVFSEIRKQFVFSAEILDTANYVVGNLRFTGNGNATTVGIHIRIGDMKNSKFLREVGYRMAPHSYIHKAIDLMLTRHEKIVFIVCSDDIDGAKAFIGNRSREIDVYFFSISPVHDMAILSTCDHVIMTVGTFGWWAGFLSNGTVVYYKHPHIPGSNVYMAHTYDDFYLPNWIGLD